MGRRRPPRRRRGGVGLGIGILGTLFFPVMIIIIVIVMIVGSLVTVRINRNNYAYDDYGYEYEANEVTRTKLASNLCTESSEWISNEIGSFSTTETRKAEEYFYSETGVQPYLLITDNLDGKGSDLTDSEAESYLASVYDSLYNDEGHMILAFVEYDYDKFWVYIYTGVSADSVIDSSARDAIISIAERYYYDDTLTNDEYFATIFDESADVLMRDYTQSHRARNVIIIILVLGAVLIVVLIAVRGVLTARARKAEATKKILDTPIGDSPENEELKRKYGDDSDGGSS